MGGASYEAGQKNEVVMCLNLPTLPFLPCFITFCSTHSYTSYFYEIFATCSNSSCKQALNKKGALFIISKNSTKSTLLSLNNTKY